MDKECVICMSLIETGDILYYSLDNENWIEHTFCYDCVKELISNSWQRYVDNIKKADCEKSLKHCLDKGLINRLTLDGTISSSIVQKIKNNDIVYETFLTGSLPEEEIHKINLEFKKILNDMHEQIDYIGEIKKIITKFNL